ASARRFSCAIHAEKETALLGGCDLLVRTDVEDRIAELANQGARSGRSRWKIGSRRTTHPVGIASRSRIRTGVLRRRAGRRCRNLDQFSGMDVGPGIGPTVG